MVVTKRISWAPLECTSNVISSKPRSLTQRKTSPIRLAVNPQSTRDRSRFARTICNSISTRHGARTARSKMLRRCFRPSGHRAPGSSGRGCATKAGGCFRRASSHPRATPEPAERGTMPSHPDVDEALGAIGHRDHSITGEYRIFGPPGTGKTTNLSRQIRRAVERFGKDAVLVTSFSRAAAAELAGQDLPVSPDRIGTL